MVLTPRAHRHVQQQLTDACERRPFVPFRIRTKGGIAFEVRRPELLSVGAVNLLLARDSDRVVIDPANVTAIEPVDVA